MNQFTINIAEKPERLVILSKLLGFSIISTIALFQLLHGDAPQGLWENFLVKSADESFSEFADGILTIK